MRGWLAQEEEEQQLQRSQRPGRGGDGGGATTLAAGGCCPTSHLAPCRTAGAGRAGGHTKCSAPAICIQLRGNYRLQRVGACSICKPPSVGTAKPKPQPPLPPTPAQTEPLRSKALSFSAVAGSRGVQEKSVDTDVVAAEVAPELLANLQALLSDLFIPLVAAQQPSRRAAESAKDEFVQVWSGGWDG